MTRHRYDQNTITKHDQLYNRLLNVQEFPDGRNLKLPRSELLIRLGSRRGNERLKQVISAPHTALTNMSPDYLTIYFYVVLHLAWWCHKMMSQYDDTRWCHKMMSEGVWVRQYFSALNKHPWQTDEAILQLRNRKNIISGTENNELSGCRSGWTAVRF